MEKEKVQLYKTLSFFVIIFTILSVYCVVWGPARHWSSSLHPARTLAVSASGEAVAVPDVATFSFSVISEGKSPADIAAENNSKINNAIEILKGKGVEKEDIKTSQYSLTPVYSRPTRDGEAFVPVIAGYRLSQTVGVKIRDFELISEVLEELPGIGINNIGGLSFEVDDDEEYLSRARADAFENAREKAKRIAKESGIKLGRIVSVSEYSSPAPYYYGKGGVADDIQEFSVAPVIEPGTQEIDITVSVVYEIR